MTEKTEKRTTSAEIKKQIAEATKAQRDQETKQELKDSGLPLAAVADRVNGLSTTTEEKPKTESKPEPTAVRPESAAEKEAAQQKSDESAALQEWKKKKGITWDAPDSVLADMRRKDQEYHAKRQKDLELERQRNPYATPTYPYPQPPVPPVPNYGYQPNGLQPPTGYPPYSPSVNPRQVVESLARDFNLPADDVERLARFNHAQFQAMIAEQQRQWQQKMTEFERENQKNAVFRDLSSDPTFRRLDVAREYHNVLDQLQESDPESFEQDPTVYRRAYDRALANIGRRYLEGNWSSESVQNQNGFTPPTNPPKPIGNGSAGGFYENENAIDAKAFADLPLEEKKKVLDRMGLRSTY